MKSLLWMLLLPNLALAAPSPPLPCATGASCTPRLLEIEAGFAQASRVEEKDFPLVASGDCRHLSPDYNSHTAHYGMVLLDSSHGVPELAVRMSFFFPENPYREWSLEKARQENTRLFPVALLPEFAYSDMNPGQSPWLYWIKRASGKIYLLGLWGLSHRILCEMAVHE